MLFPGRALTVREVGALSDFDNITVRIADVAARLAVLGDRLGDELRSSTFPHFIARLNVRNAEIHKAVDVIRVGDAQRYRRLIRSRPAPNVQNHPDIRQLKVPRRVAVTQAQNASAEDLFVVASRSIDVGHGEKLCDADPLSRGHLIALLFDMYGVHGWLLSIECAEYVKHYYRHSKRVRQAWWSTFHCVFQVHRVQFERPRQLCCKPQMAVSSANSSASRLCVHPFDPLSARCGRYEWIRKVLCFPRNLVVPELHDAHGVGRLSVIRQDEFGDPKITAANDSSDGKPLFARLTSALVLYVAS